MNTAAFKILCIFCLSTSIFANEILDDEFRLLNSMSIEELLNTDIATGVPMKQKFAPAVTSILTADEIRKSGARTLHEALEQVPGLHIYPSDIDLMTEKVSIRGIQTGFNPQVLFLIDGLPLSDMLNGHPGFLFKMPVSIIHRVEIIRGPGSALHGADAFSGVINIISKKHDTIEDQVGVRYGSFNTYEAWVHKSVKTDEFNMGLALSLMHSDGDDGRIVDVDGLSGTPNAAFSLAPGAVSTDYDMVFLHGDIKYKEFNFNLLAEQSRDLGLGAGHLRILDPVGHVDRDKVIAELKHTNSDWFDNTLLQSSVYVSYLDSQANYYPMPAGVTVMGTTYPDGRQGQPYAVETMFGVSTGAIYSGIDKHTINTKVGFKYGNIDPSQKKNFGPGAIPDGTLTDLTDNLSAVYMKEHTRKSIYALLQDEYSIDNDLSLTIGLRYDNYNDFGGTFNPRLALVWQESEEVTFKAMYGRAFRAPTFGELHIINSPAFLGNPDLEPETIDTYEIALNYRAAVHTKLNVFYYKAKDLIDYDQNTPAVAQNMNEQTGYGTELEMEYSVNNVLSLRGNYAYQHSEDDKTGEKVKYAPVHQAFAQVQYQPNRDWNTNVQYFYIGKRYRDSTDTRAPLEADSLVNITVSRSDIVQGLDLLLSARNVLDEDYREPSSASIPNDYPMQGRYLFAELRYRF